MASWNARNYLEWGNTTLLSRRGVLFLLFVFFLLHPNTAPLTNSLTSTSMNNLGSAGKYSFICSYPEQQRWMSAQNRAVRPNQMTVWKRKVFQRSTGVIGATNCTIFPKPTTCDVFFVLKISHKESREEINIFTSGDRSRSFSNWMLLTGLFLLSLPLLPSFLLL